MIEKKAPQRLVMLSLDHLLNRTAFVFGFDRLSP
jgi:hypothetical protein